MIDLSRVEKYYVACGYTDLRRGIDGLAAIVSQQYGRDLCEDSLFLFCGRRTDRIKALYYSGMGIYCCISGSTTVRFSGRGQNRNSGCWMRVVSAG